MSRTAKEAYLHLHRLKEMAFAVSAVTAVLWLAVRFDENASLWLMSAAAVCAGADIFLVPGYVHAREKLIRQMKESRDMHE
jgi:hypothetical protein